MYCEEDKAERHSKRQNMNDTDSARKQELRNVVRQLSLRLPVEELSDLQCPQCGCTLNDPWTLGSGRTVCAPCVTRVAGEHVPPAANRLLAAIVQHCSPQSVEASVQRLKGNEFFKQGQWDQAVEAYTTAVKFDENSSASFGNRSIAHLKLKRYAQAIEDARKAVELRPLWAKWHLRLAAAMRADGHHSQALMPLLCAAALENSNVDLSPGSQVRIRGLEDADCDSTHNGSKGKCVQWSDVASRWEVRLESGEIIQMKTDNLEAPTQSYSTSVENDAVEILQLGNSLPRSEDVDLPESPAPRRISAQAVEALRSDLDCCMCASLLCEPVALPCGHCMCRDCVARLLDHALQTDPACPLCRHSLMELLRQVNKRARQNQLEGMRFAHGGAQLTTCRELSRLLSTWYPQEYAERLGEVRAPQSEWVPIFVCSLSAPFIPTPLHVFEPRYRLMMRRCVESNQRFGMCLPSENGFADTGTMLFIDRFEQLPDGRSMVGTKGVSRFSVVERGVLDGYSTALIRPFEEDAQGFPTSAGFHQEALALHRGAKKVMEKIQSLHMASNLEHQLGPLPDVDSPHFDAHMSFYAAQFLQMFTHDDSPALVFRQPEKERWDLLLQACSKTPLGEGLKTIRCEETGEADENETGKANEND